MTGSIYIINLKERRAMYEAKQGTLCTIQGHKKDHLSIRTLHRPGDLYLVNLLDIKVLTLIQL